jgi:Cdc6-like AAA superfamily ATPase
MTPAARVEARQRLEQVFTPHKPIDLPELLAGRLPLLYKATDAINTEGLHPVLYGDRGTGKTSLARVLAVSVQEPEKDDGRRAIIVSCGSTDSYSLVWRKVCQEIQLAQRQLGFVQESVAPLAAQVLDVGNHLDNPNDVRLFVRGFPNPCVIVIDEFDRLPNTRDRRLMADTIKLFSDTAVPATIVLVGVAGSIGELITEHQSVARNIAPMHVEPMKPEELAEIVQRGFSHAGLDFESGIDTKIASWSQGYPHYTHLLGLWAGRKTLEAGRLTVTVNDLESAVQDALENAAGGVQHEYETAVASAREGTLFKAVLLACALAEKDSLGRFSAVSVRYPLAEVTHNDYTTGAFQSHLAKFCEADRGPILKKSGTRRNYRWQFINPQLIPYVRLQGMSDRLLAAI